MYNENGDGEASFEDIEQPAAGLFVDCNFLHFHLRTSCRATILLYMHGTNIARAHTNYLSESVCDKQRTWVSWVFSFLEKRIGNEGTKPFIWNLNWNIKIQIDISLFSLVCSFIHDFIQRALTPPILFSLTTINDFLTYGQHSGGLSVFLGHMWLLTLGGISCGLAWLIKHTYTTVN